MKDPGFPGRGAGANHTPRSDPSGGGEKHSNMNCENLAARKWPWWSIAAGE